MTISYTTKKSLDLNNETSELRKTDSIVCSDVVFDIYNYALNKVECELTKLSAEVYAINSDIVKRSARDRLEVVKRTFMAKEYTIGFQQEI